ncbi:DNA (cytosine-5-)-methyltransferase [Paraburkholderia youngii]|uniref:DNA (cytosine-5-)-methyltransferase n=1 Tax=Paraburkholderia youngii TaxID=2782701 RepID=UPI003D203904
MRTSTPLELRVSERAALRALLPQRPRGRRSDFDFIDLFAGIGGIRRGFEAAGGRCVFTSEWNPQAVRTYRANYHDDPAHHRFATDIRKVTLSDREEISDEDAYAHIRSEVPDHDVLLAGFPCQPFSIAGVSKKNSLGRAHGFECKTQGTLFFDVARILAARRPAAFVLENVKNLRSHDRGRTFRVILETLTELGYEIADAEASGGDDPKIVDGSHFTPQHRERVVLAGFRKDLLVHDGFTLRDIDRFYPARKPRLGDILEEHVDARYTLSPKLWAYLNHYALKHQSKGNGFGYGLVGRDDVTRTLSARYPKDFSEILVAPPGYRRDLPFDHAENAALRPRGLTPRECARLMGYDGARGTSFRIPCSNAQAYKQFGNSVVVPVFGAVAALMKDRIVLARTRRLASAMVLEELVV